MEGSEFLLQCFWRLCHNVHVWLKMISLFPKRKRKRRHWQKRETRENKLLPSFSKHLPLPVYPSFSSICLCAVSCSLLHCGSQQRTLLGRLAQLYLLLDGSSRVVDKWVYETSHYKTQTDVWGFLVILATFCVLSNCVTSSLTCKHSSNNGTHSCQEVSEWSEQRDEEVCQWQVLK